MQAHTHNEMLRLRNAVAAARSPENTKRLAAVEKYQKRLTKRKRRSKGPTSWGPVQNIKESNFSPKDRAFLESYSKFVRNQAKKTELEQQMANLNAAEEVGTKRKRPANATRRRHRRKY